MLGATLLFALVLGQTQAGGPDSSPAALVARLGAPRYADRQAAAEALERLGGPALPALRGARDSRDPEIRARAPVLIERIETGLLTQPTRLQLEFQDAPLAEVTKSLALQAGFKVALFPPSLPKWRFQRVTLRVSQPVDFWTAVDQLCDVAGLQYNPGTPGSNGQREPSFVFTDGTGRTLTPNSDHGPFRVSLLSVDYERHVSYVPTESPVQFELLPPRPRPAARPTENRPRAGPARRAPVTNVEFSVRLLLAAEPRLILTQRAALQLKEVSDDRGNSLIPASSSSTTGRAPSHLDMGFPLTSGSVMHLQVPLHRPAASGETIKRMRGMIPLVVSSRKPDPLVVPLASAVGKTFENPDVQLTLHDIRAMPNTQNTVLELTVKANERAGTSSRGEAPGYNNWLERIDPRHLHIDVLDSRGQLIPWFQSVVDADSARTTLTLTHLPQTTEPKELRYYALTHGEVSVPFEFSDIPMP
jgi:hypothetical protein